jgi:sec-independent protein translocase protein TatC
MMDIDESKAPLIEHLIELRRRLLISVGALVVSGAVCYYFADQLLAFLVQPLKDGFGADTGRLVYTKLYEAFFVELKVALFGAFFISFPITANQLWLFIAPGLYAKEKRALLPFLLATPVLFVGGAAFAYYLVMPTAFHFFLKFQGDAGGLSVEALPSMDSYLSLVMQFILAFGISFLLPVLVMLLNRAGIVTRAQLIGARRYVIVGAVVVAAVLTPPDVISQLMLAIPLCLLYELALIAIWFTDRRAAKESDEQAIVKAD